MWSSRAARQVVGPAVRGTRTGQSVRAYVNAAPTPSTQPRISTTGPTFRSGLTPASSRVVPSDAGTPFVTDPSEFVESLNRPTLPNDPRASNIDDLRRQAGWLDPMDPDFQMPQNTRAALVLRYALLVCIPLAAYHFSTTVRGWTDDAIDALRKEYRQRFPQTAEKKLKPGMKGYNAQKDAADTPKKGQVLSIFSVAKAEGKEEKGKPAPTVKAAAPAPAATTPAAKAADAKPAIASSAAAATPSVAVTPAAAAAAKPIDTTEKQIRDALELVAIIQLNEQVAALIAAERAAGFVAADSRPAAVAIPDELPAAAAIQQVRDIVVNLQLPALPPPPRFTGAPRNAAEARERLDALAEWKSNYEVAMGKTIGTLSEQLVADLSPALKEAITSARVTFDSQLPERLRRAANATANALESSSLTELAEISRDITAKKAAEWADILKDEVEKSGRALQKATIDVLRKQDQSLHSELDPLVNEQLKRLEQQRAEIQSLETELGRKKAIEKTGERVHALTSLLIRMEEALTRDTKAQTFVDAATGSHQTRTVDWTQEFQADWQRMTQLAAQDAALKKLMSSVPNAQFVGDLARDVKPLATPSELRHSFFDVERAVREATFLPPGEVQQEEVNPLAVLYAKAFSALSLKEGQALRPAAQTDADRLNNATFYVLHPKERDLSAAIRAIESIENPRARAEAAEWLAAAKRRVQVETAVKEVRKNIETTAKTYAKSGR